jgi:hypothetical protein
MLATQWLYGVQGALTEALLCLAEVGLGRLVQVLFALLLVPARNAH